MERQNGSTRQWYLKPEPGTLSTRAGQSLVITVQDPNTKSLFLISQRKAKRATKKRVRVSPK